MKKVIAILIAGTAMLFASQTQALDLPNPIPNRMVHDFANAIDNDVEQKIENQLAQYEKTTSIEMAVVTVASLEDYSVEDYTQRLAQKWGVGKKAKNNGLVFLWAPTERKVRIEIGYGLEPYLTDGEASSIIRNDIIPNFKAGNFGEGLTAGVTSILNTLGTKTMADRQAEQELAKARERAEAERREREWQLAEKQRAQAAAERAKKLAAIFAVLKVLALPLIILAGIGIAIYAKVRKQQKIKEAPQLLETTKKLFAAAEKGFSHPDVSNEARQELKSAQTEMKKAETAAEKTNVDWLLVYTLCVSASYLLSGANKTASDNKEEAAEARREGMPLFRRLPGMIERAEKKAKKEGVYKSTLNKVARAEEKYKKIVPVVKKDPVDWLVVYPALQAIEELLDDALNTASEQRESFTLARSDNDDGPKFGGGGGISIGGGGGGGSPSISFGGGSFGGGGASGSY